MFLNDVLSGGCIPKEWKESRVVLVHKGGSKKELKIMDCGNYKCHVEVVYDGVKRENKWMGEESGMLGDIQGGFRKGRRTEDNLFMLDHENCLQWRTTRDDLAKN